MKDKRLDILLEHFKKLVVPVYCNYCIKDQGCKWCLMMMKDGFPTKINCNGNLIKCELED